MNDCFGTLNVQDCGCKMEGKTEESYHPHVLFWGDFAVAVLFVVFCRHATDCGTARETCRRADRFY